MDYTILDGTATLVPTLAMSSTLSRHTRVVPTLAKCGKILIQPDQSFCLLFLSTLRWAPSQARLYFNVHPDKHLHFYVGYIHGLGALSVRKTRRWCLWTSVLATGARLFQDVGLLYGHRFGFCWTIFMVGEIDPNECQRHGTVFYFGSTRGSSVSRVCFYS